MAVQNQCLDLLAVGRGVQAPMYYIIRILKIERLSPPPLCPYLCIYPPISLQACNLCCVFCFEFKFSRFVPGLDYDVRMCTR
jgi:hypothetical protein